MSAIWSRPPDFKTRKTSPSTLGLSGQRLSTPLEITRSTEAAVNGQRLDLPDEEHHVRHAEQRCVVASLGDHLRGHVQTDDLATCSDYSCRQKRIEARPAAQVEDVCPSSGSPSENGLPTPQNDSVKRRTVVTSISAGVVTQPLGALGTDRELPLLVGCGCDPD